MVRITITDLQDERSATIHHNEIANTFIAWNSKTPGHIRTLLRDIENALGEGRNDDAADTAAFLDLDISPTD